MKNNQAEGHIFEEMIKFLEKNVLVINPSQRRTTKAENVREQLIIAFKAYDELASGGPASPQRAKFFDRVIKLVHIPRRGQPQLEANTQDWIKSLSGPIKACEFGPAARLLVCATDTDITAYSLDHVCLTNNFEDLVEFDSMSLSGKGRSWLGSIGVSPQYIAAATDHHEFDVSEGYHNP
jgi:hypothetical protein